MLETRQSYSRTRGITLVALFAVLLAIFSVFEIPLPLVPITLQVFFVFLIVNLLGAYYGTLACLVYLLVGLLGIPVFAGATGGPGVIFGPVGGYLIAFPVATLVGGSISGRVSPSKSKDFVKVSIATLVSLLLIYGIGMAWLGESLKLSINGAFVAGVLPFIPVDTAKAIVAVPIALYIRATRKDLPVHR